MCLIHKHLEDDTDDRSYIYIPYVYIRYIYIATSGPHIVKKAKTNTHGHIAVYISAYSLYGVHGGLGVAAHKGASPLVGTTVAGRGEGRGGIGE